MAHYCGECTYLKVDGDTKFEKYWCDWQMDWKAANEIECYKYCEAYTRSSSVVRSAIKYSEESQKSTTGCYITTLLCKVLSMDDNNIYLNTLRNFRNNYLQKNQEGIEILLKYDIIGPIISKNIENDNGKFNIAYNLFNKYIVPTVSCINEYEYNKAITLYMDMTNKLMKFYDIKDVNINSESLKQYDSSLCGHGILRKKLSYV